MENLCATREHTTTPCKLDSRTPILHPVVLGAPETSIYAGTRTSSSSGSDSDSDTETELTNAIIPAGHSNGVIAPGSTLNFEHCTDVIVGPMTQFHGPVTIYQNVTTNTQNLNGSIEQQKEEETNNSPKICHHGDEVVLNKLKRNLKGSGRIKWIILISFIVSVTGALISVIIVFTNKSYKKPSDDELSTTENYTVPPNISLQLRTREEWQGKPSTNSIRKLLHPTSYVVVSHTAGSFCNNFNKCSALVRNIQTYHMQLKKEADIGYNFLIGGDGDAYVGRGWNLVNYHKNKTIEISMIGEYTLTDQITPNMISTLKNLLELGVQLEKLSKTYKIVCHYQTEDTQSPGKNVCIEVAKLPNYFDGWVQLDGI